MIVSLERSACSATQSERSVLPFNRTLAMVVYPCAHTLEHRWDLDQLTTKLKGTDHSHNHNHYVRDRESGLYSLFRLSVALNLQVS